MSAYTSREIQRPAGAKDRVWEPNRDAKANQRAQRSAPGKGDILERYLSETRRYEILSEEEKTDLAMRAQQYGDKQAANKLVNSHLRLVVKMAMQFQGIWTHNLLDLIQEGNLGLIQAVHKFDPSRGVKFSYYASFWIRAHMLRFLMDYLRLVKIGTTQNQRRLFYRLNKEKELLEKEGFEPKTELLAKRLGIPEKEISDMDQRLNKPEISLDASIREDSDEPLIGFVPASAESVEAEVSRKQMAGIVRKTLVDFSQGCNERELEILENRLMSETPLSLQQIANHYGISRERVRQIQSKVLAKLKVYFECNIPGFASLRFALN
jgi:RNA polymerase sigma-32 factor